ncbi:MAG: Cell cycle protein [Chthoniobacteraceae bacterium]|nr:Cell cycle protein [Chthoniobacteraceae bacterium]MDB6172952.1 Cell cycle protein [Chthoniobacteraceae bacterium]
MNWVLFATMLALAIFGIIAVYSATFFSIKKDEYWHKQAIWVGLGVVVFLVTSLMNYRWIKWVALPLYLVSIVLVILTYTGMGEEHGGAKCWLRLPGIGTFQPSQLCLIAGVIVVALFLSQFRKLHPFIKLCLVAAIVGGPMALILKQPDFGMTLVWIPSVMAMLFLGGIPKRYLISIILIGLCALPLAINFVLKPYQHDRIMSFIDPTKDKQGTSWAINQSLIAVGSGGLSGKGFKAPNTQVEQGFLPGTTVHTDYIFSAIAEQWGFVGGMMLLSGFALLLLCCLFTAYHAADEFGLLITIGFTAQIFFHVYQNIGMTVALMPITGLPLPLISYGGTFVLMNMFAFGLVNSVWVHRKMLPE